MKISKANIKHIWNKTMNRQQSWPIHLDIINHMRYVILQCQAFPWNQLTFKWSESFVTYYCKIVLHLQIDDMWRPCFPQESADLKWRLKATSSALLSTVYCMSLHSVQCSQQACKCENEKKHVWKCKKNARREFKKKGNNFLFTGIERVVIEQWYLSAKVRNSQCMPISVLSIACKICSLVISSRSPQPTCSWKWCKDYVYAITCLS